MIGSKDEEQEQTNKVNFIAGNAKGGMPRVVRKELDELNEKIENVDVDIDIPVTDLSGRVDKTGDTMTGRLTVSGEGVVADWVRATGGTGDGGMVMRPWTADDRYASLATNNMSGGEYVLISNGTTTYLGAGSGGTVYIRSSANNNSNQTYQDTSGLHTAVLQVTNEIQLADGAWNDPSLTFSADGDTGIYRSGNDSLTITVGGQLHRFATDGLHLASGDWFRAYGTAGFYLGTYGLGWHAADSSWMRLYNGSRTKGIYSNGGRIAAYYNATGQSETQRKDWEYSSIRAQCNQYNGLSIRNVNDSGTAQLRPASGILYIRNHNDSGYYPVHGGAYTNASSIQWKQDVATWETPKAAGAAVGPDAVVSALDKVKAMRPVTYRMKKEDYLSVSPQSSRRKEALMRLQDFRANRGEEPFQSDELVHECGRDCDGSVEAPCLAYRNWEKGHLGLISEELAEVAPEVVVDSMYGDNSGVDTYALTTVLVKAIQELSDRVDELKAAKKPDGKGD